MSPDTKPQDAGGENPSAPKIPYREFRDLVKLDLTGNADPRIEALVRRPEYAVRWWRILDMTRKSIERQNAAAKMYLDAHPHRNTRGGVGAAQYQQSLTEYHKERANREWVLMTIVDRMAEARETVTEQDGITAKSLEALTSALIRCDNLLTQGQATAAQQALRRALDSLHTIASLEGATATGSTIDGASSPD